MVELKISLEGEQLMSRALIVSSLAIKDFKAPLTESAALLQKAFQLNFEERGGLFGGWAPRKPQMRRGTRVDTWPLLEKTGTLRKSFYSTVSGDTAVLGNSDRIFGFHQSNAARRKLPRRIMIAIRNSEKVLIQKIFQTHIVDSTRSLR